jgi:hypothetical protein
LLQLARGQNRNAPNMNNKTIVITTEISTDPRQPMRLEKNRNMFRIPR